MANNKVTTYLLYGIGEIVLVVVGILIAVQIDDWNKKREIDKLTLSTLEQVKSDLVQNINNNQLRINYYLWSDSMANSILRGSVDTTFFNSEQVKEFVRLLNEKKNYFFTTRGYEVFKNMVAKTELPDSTLVEMDAYYNGFRGYDRETYEQYNNLISEYMTYARKNLPWHAELKDVHYYQPNAPQHAYAMVQDPVVKNYLFELYQANINSIRVLLLSSHLAQGLYLQLAAITKQEELPEVISEWYKPISPEDVKMLSGKYESSLNSHDFRIFYENGKLYYQDLDNGYVTSLFKWKNDLYYVDNYSTPLLMIHTKDPITISLSRYPVPLFSKK